MEHKETQTLQRDIDRDEAARMARLKTDRFLERLAEAVKGKDFPKTFDGKIDAAIELAKEEGLSC